MSGGGVRTKVSRDIDQVCEVSLNSGRLCKGKTKEHGLNRNKGEIRNGNEHNDKQRTMTLQRQSEGREVHIYPGHHVTPVRLMNR